MPWPQGRRGHPANPSPDRYRIVNTGLSTLACDKCGKSSTLKSNKGIHEERERLAQGVLDPALRLTCPSCGGSRLRKYGKTRHGSDRYQCFACKKTVSVGKSTLRHRKPHKNEIVFSLIVNKVPLNRMCEIADLNFKVLYDKIDFIYEQCRAFSADRERKLAGMSFGSRYLCTDRQDYIVNWGDRREKRTVQLTAISTADNESGYVFGMLPNFDKRILPADLEQQAKAAGDAQKPFAMREFARLWTNADYQASAGANAAGRKMPSRQDLDAIEDLDIDQQLPTTGCQVHADYMMHGHYWLLRHHFQGAEKVRFFIDNDAGLLGACMGAFSDRIKVHTADIIMTDIEKSMTVGNRKARFSEEQAWFEEARKAFPGLSAPKAKAAILAKIIEGQRLGLVAGRDRINDLWFDMPFPDYAEPMKKLRFVTYYDDLPDEHTANLMLKASLWPIDSVFNRIRSRLSVCDRAVTSVRRGRRLWHKYAPYDPALLEKMLTIYRCWQNYVWKDERNKKTAAQKLGLAAGAIRMQDILYHK